MKNRIGKNNTELIHKRQQQTSRSSRNRTDKKEQRKDQRHSPMVTHTLLMGVGTIPLENNFSISNSVEDALPRVIVKGRLKTNQNKKPKQKAIEQ